VTLHLTFEGDTLGHLLANIRGFLDSLPGEGAVQGLVNLDEPLPAAVKRASKERGAAPTPAQVEAVFQAEAPPCTREEVAESARAYLAAFSGISRLAERVGHHTLGTIPDNDLWRVKRDLDRAVKAGTP
jgi:hypothetical protein